MENAISKCLATLVHETADAAAGKSAGDLARKAWGAALARIYLRRASRVGIFTLVRGRPRIRNKGVLRIGRRVRIC